MSARASLGALALLTCASAVADAQLRASANIGGGEVGFGAVPASAVTMGGEVEYHRGWLEGRASGGTYRFENASTSSRFGSGALLLRSPRRMGLIGELLALGSTTDHHGFYRAQRLEAKAGASWVADVATTSARYGVSRVMRDRQSLTASRFELVAQATLGRTTLTLSGARAQFTESMMVVRDTTYFVAGFPFRGRYNTEADVARAYLDAEANVQWQVRRATVGVGVGARRGDATTASERWQHADLTLPLNSNVAVMATGGRKAGVPEERIPSGAFAILGVRLSFRSDEQPVQARPIDGRDTPRLVALDVGGGRRSISIMGLAAKRVEIIADFTDWQPVELAAVGPGVWHVALPMGPGAHRINIRVDGGAWMPPPGLPVTADEFMGTVGVLLIE